MGELRHYVTAEEAAVIRVHADGDLRDRGFVRVWAATGGPIRVIDQPNGRACCRACGHVLMEGTRSILFGFRSHPFARTVNAYIHADPGECPAREEEA